MYLLIQSIILWLASVEGARYYDDEETKTLSELFDIFVSYAPCFLMSIAFFLINLKCGYWGKWLKESHWMKKSLVVLWWIAAIVSGFCIFTLGLLLIQIVWIALFEFVFDPIMNLAWWITHWILFIVGFLFVSVVVPIIICLSAKIPRWLSWVLGIVLSGVMIYVLVLFSMTYGEELHLFPV